MANREFCGTESLYRIVISQSFRIFRPNLSVKELLKASPCQEIAKFICKIAFFGIKSTLQQRIDHISTTPAAMGV
jgi:hypothetical protein